MNFAITSSGNGFPNPLGKYAQIFQLAEDNKPTRCGDANVPPGS